MEIHTSLIFQDSVSCSSFATTLLTGGFRHLCRVQAQKPSSRSNFSSFPSFDKLGSSFLQMGSSWKHQLSISRGSSVFSPMSIGSNTNIDTDDMFDDLFKKYGKVVFRRNDQKPATSEIDDDAESLSCKLPELQMTPVIIPMPFGYACLIQYLVPWNIRKFYYFLNVVLLLLVLWPSTKLFMVSCCFLVAVAAAKVASEVKASDIRVLFVKPLVYWTQFFIIATAFSRPQIDAIGTKIRDMAEIQYGKVAAGDSKPNSWTLLDFGDVIVHIFLPQQRAFYNLEEFYGNATPIELPFENQQQFRN